MRRTVLVVILMAGLMVISGCQTESESTEESQAVAEGEIPHDDEVMTSFEIGITELSDGRARAVGVLGYNELEGGFWALYDIEPGEIPEGGEIVVVIANIGELDTSACSLEGKLVVADGVMSEGVSTRMAGPEIIADDVYEVPAE